MKFLVCIKIRGCSLSATHLTFLFLIIDEVFWGEAVVYMQRLSQSPQRQSIPAIKHICNSQCDKLTFHCVSEFAKEFILIDNTISNINFWEFIVYCSG